MIEYALLGEDYDSVVTHYRNIIENKDFELSECDFQQEVLQEIISELRAYISSLEEEVAKNKRKLKFMQSFAYISASANALLVIMLIVK